MLAGYLAPLLAFHLVDSGGNLPSAGIEYGANRQVGFGVLVGFRFQGADAHYGDTQAEG